MSLTLPNFEIELKNAKAIQITQKSFNNQKGLASIYEAQQIPPLNSLIKFEGTLQTFSLVDNPALAAMDHTILPQNFNWRQNSGKKKDLISEPGNQMLCGSCWAISTAGIIADNHVVSGTVDWKPNLSTTWSLSCYPQLQCKGGNPAKLYLDIAENGIVSNKCVDYSWCSENDTCNGKATKHFEKSKEINLSSLIPTCGCYYSGKHYVYSIEEPKFVSLGKGGLNEDNFTNTIKKHIFKYGPVQGGFVVFKNFMHGIFSRINGGVYLENGVYDKGKIQFDSNQTSTKNYAGSHAVAIIGWGVEKNVTIDNNGTKKDIPYWYCRNSWSQKWGDGGYFKMAMYPHNKISQFDKTVIIKTLKNNVQAGGMVMIRATKPPELKTLPQVKSNNLKKIHDNSYYKEEEKTGGKKTGGKTEEKKTGTKNILHIGLLTFGLCIVFFVFYMLITYLRNKIPHKRHRSRHRRISRRGREGVYKFVNYDNNS